MVLPAIFFGSVCPLADHLRQTLSGASRPACLMLDFAGVSGFDFSAVNVLGRFVQTANAAGVQVVLSALSEQLKAGLESSLPPSAFAELLVEPNADRGLERCEDIVIAAWKADVGTADKQRATLLEHAADDVECYLDRQIQFEDLMAELSGWKEPREYCAGEALAGLDAPQEGLQLLLSGQTSAHDAAGARLYQLGPGDAIWPAGALDGKAASVVADKPCRTMVLTPDARRWLEEHKKRLALKLCRYLLAGRFQTESDSGER